MMCRLFPQLFVTALFAGSGSLVSYAAPLQEPIPTGLDGKKIQFSYSPSFKFTPLLIECGSGIPGKPNTYALQGEDRQCTITYTPNASRCTAAISVSGARDSAEIRLQFDNGVSGTAHMKWNRIEYPALKFRITDADNSVGYLQRMGDPVGDVVPQSLKGKTLTIDFAGAVDREPTPDNDNPPWTNCTATPLVVQFPADSNTFETRYGMPNSQNNPPLKVEYELMSSGACVCINGRSHNIEIELDYADSVSGLAHMNWTAEEGCGWEVKCATFTLCESSAKNGNVYWPHFSGLQPADAALVAQVTRLAVTPYASAVEELYKRRLLSILPAIACGAADVNAVIPQANGTTALHNACGLGHTEIVQWLVDHGADLSAKTAKGSSVEDCIGGPNAKAIRAIIRKARASKK